MVPIIERDFQNQSLSPRGEHHPRHLLLFPMPSIPVSVQRDHLVALVKASKPLAALAELIWNGFDADASEVNIEFGFNGIDSLESIRVRDNGRGIPFADAESMFGKLGGSWKRLTRMTPNGRGMHGQSGKGRFKAFGLGSHVKWRTTSMQNDMPVDFVIGGDMAQLENFEASQPVPSVLGQQGTEVTISGIEKDFVSLYNERSADELAKLFAVYLTEYPNTTLIHQGRHIDPRSVQRGVTDYPLDEVQEVGGAKASVNLTIIEWTVPTERGLYLCDARGIALHEIPAGIQAPGYHFTAYLKSDIVRRFDQENLLEFDEMNPGLEGLTTAAKAKMRDHFRKRAAEAAASLVRGWKEEEIYPYLGDPKDPLETAERQIFDVVAVNVSSYLTSFEQSDVASKKFTFTLLKQALAENPASVQRIFADVLHLPKEKQDEFAKLLEQTSLTSIIAAAKVVTDRLNFLKGLDSLIFDKETRKVLLERDQLHKILADETWIFGEEYHLTSNEETLNEVLVKHLHRLGKRCDDDTPITRENGRQGRIDLMLGRSVPQPRSDEHEYLVVELKRPSRDIDGEVLNQVKSYAIAVARDERFAHTRTRWNFWAVSAEMSDEAEFEVKQNDRPPGQYWISADSSVQVWAKTWGQIIRDCRGRLNFFREKLNFEANRETAKAYLKSAHDKYVPQVGIGVEVGDSSPNDQMLEPAQNEAVDGTVDGLSPQDAGPGEDLSLIAEPDQSPNPKPVNRKRTRQ